MLWASSGPFRLKFALRSETLSEKRARTVPFLSRNDSPGRTPLGFARDKPFDRPFDKLTVLSKVEGLTALTKAEGLRFPHPRPVR